MTKTYKLIWKDKIYFKNLYTLNIQSRNKHNNLIFLEEHTIKVLKLLYFLINNYKIYK